MFLAHKKKQRKHGPIDLKVPFRRHLLDTSYETLCQVLGMKDEYGILMMSVAQRSWNLSCSKEYLKLNIMGILELNLAAIYFRIQCHPISFEATRPFWNAWFWINGVLVLRVSVHLTLTSELALVLKLEMERKDRMEKPKIYLVDFLFWLPA